MFGLVTKRQLRKHLEALEERDRKRDLEWTDMFEKFRRLYARLAKREKQAADPEGHPYAQEPVSDAPPGIPASRQWELAKLAAQGNGS